MNGRSGVIAEQSGLIPTHPGLLRRSALRPVLALGRAQAQAIAAAEMCALRRALPQILQRTEPHYHFRVAPQLSLQVLVARSTTLQLAATGSFSPPAPGSTAKPESLTLGERAQRTILELRSRLTQVSLLDPQPPASAPRATRSLETARDAASSTALETPRASAPLLPARVLIVPPRPQPTPSTDSPTASSVTAARRAAASPSMNGSELPEHQLRRITDQVVTALDQRARAFRERMGKA